MYLEGEGVLITLCYKGPLEHCDIATGCCPLYHISKTGLTRRSGHTLVAAVHVATVTPCCKFAIISVPL